MDKLPSDKTFTLQDIHDRGMKTVLQRLAAGELKARVDLTWNDVKTAMPVETEDMDKLVGIFFRRLLEMGYGVVPTATDEAADDAQEASSDSETDAGTEHVLKSRPTKPPLLRQTANTTTNKFDFGALSSDDEDENEVEDEQVKEDQDDGVPDESKDEQVEEEDTDATAVKQLNDKYQKKVNFDFVKPKSENGAWSCDAWLWEAVLKPGALGVVGATSTAKTKKAAKRLAAKKFVEKLVEEFGISFS